MKIGIIEGSIREGRNGTSVAQWVVDQAQTHDGVEPVPLSLADFDLPLFTAAAPPAAAPRQYDSEKVAAWGAALDECDAFVFVTPEYNHSVPGALKNAIDSVGPEFQDKAAAIVSYGADGGVRAVEHLRQILANFNMYVIRTQLSLSLFTEFGDNGVQSNERRADEAQKLFDALVAAGA